MKSVTGYTDLQEERVSMRASVGQGGGGATGVVFQPRACESFV